MFYLEKSVPLSLLRHKKKKKSCKVPCKKKFNIKLLSLKTFFSLLTLITLILTLFSLIKFEMVRENSRKIFS